MSPIYDFWGMSGFEPRNICTKFTICCKLSPVISQVQYKQSCGHFFYFFDRVKKCRFYADFKLVEIPGKSHTTKCYLPKYFCQTVAEVGRLLLLYTLMGIGNGQCLFNEQFFRVCLIIKILSFFYAYCQFCESKVLRSCSTFLKFKSQTGKKKRLKICNKNF